MMSPNTNGWSVCLFYKDGAETLPKRYKTYRGAKQAARMAEAKATANGRDWYRTNMASLPRDIANNLLEVEEANRV